MMTSWKILWISLVLLFCCFDFSYSLKRKGSKYEFRRKRNLKRECTVPEKELITNPDFNKNLDGWSCTSCTMKRIKGGYCGNYAAQISRWRKWGSLRTTIKIKPGRYYFTGFLKILRTKNTKKPYYQAQAMAKVHYSNRGPSYWKFGSTYRIQPEHRWHKVGGDITVGEGAVSMDVYLQVEDMTVGFLVDHLSCTEIVPEPNWRAAADKRIEEIRKADIDVRINGTCKEIGYDLKVEQISHHFGFGGAVKWWLMGNPYYKAFQDFILKNFNWAVIENGLKWRNDESTKGHFDISFVEGAVNQLVKNGLHVRGHTLFYGRNDPSWVRNLTREQTLEAINKRIQSTMVPLKGKLSMWDVNNENLRDDTYERLTGDPNITMKMFQIAHKTDPKPMLYLNDMMIVNYRHSTVAYVDQAMAFKEAGIPIGGIGIQSHIAHPPDIAIHKRRLDEVATVGLPIWISELTYEESNVVRRVQVYEDLMRLYFSHPAVEGIMFWIVWSNGWRPRAALLNKDFTPNEVGKMYLKLRSEWTTAPVKYDLSQGPTVIRGFHGNYKITLSKFGKALWKKTLNLGKEGTVINIHLPKCLKRVPTVIIG